MFAMLMTAQEPRSTAYLQLGRGRQHGWEGTEKFSVPCSVPKLANQVTLREISSRNATVSDWVRQRLACFTNCSIGHFVFADRYRRLAKIPFRRHQE
jgi:hypothetical protein